MNQLSILKTQFIDKFQRLDTCQNQISEQLLGTEDAVQEYLDDMEDAENYRDRYIEICTRVDLKIRETVVPTETEKRSFKLPKIELKKFSGEAKDFLAFWSQFQKIHNDKSIAEEDKMQYLLQSMEPKSKAERLVLSFPATAENYPKAIDQLKERFGREDLTKTDLSALYDELEGKLRSLESLGRTQEKYGDFLTPLVESCLPEEILMAWERKRNTETDAKGSRTLEHLMTFLRLEVQGEEMVQLAKSGFGTPIRKKDSPTESVKPTELTTASALASSVKSSDQERKVRVLIDTACENSYISERVTSILKATPLREETIIHSLFGGNETKPKHHSVYSIEVSDLKRSYACCFEVLSEKKICGFISKIIELIPGRDGEIRTVRLKTQHGTVIRPVQRIFPLEVQAIANSDKELKEESVSVKSTKPEKVLNINDAIIKKYTSSGRLVKEPKRLDLLNYNCYRFETLPKSQRGEYVVNGNYLCE
ncbi:uncharacterized protein TNCV_755671 [Trichonephila clavipes]|nr:uncharacterized protein TNCV_755671 [Trichonephila clavipes]